MPVILTKKSDTPGSVPGTASLTNLAGGAELAVNTADKRLFSMNSTSAIIEVGTNPSSLSVAGAASVNILTATTATITTLNATSATVTNLGVTSLTVSSLSLTNATFTSATITTLKSTSATIDNLSSTSANVTTLTGTTFGTTATTQLRGASAQITTATVTSANITTLTGTTFGATATTQLRGASGGITTLTGTSANITTITGTTIGTTASSTIRGASAALTQLSGTSAGITTVTGTTAGFSSANITQFQATSATATTLTSTSANITTLSGTNFSATSLTLSNALSRAQGGTGTSLTPTNGQLLIGNGSNYTLATITAGTGVTVTNATGSITIAATGSGGTVTSVTASTPLASSGGTTPNISISSSTGTGAVVLADNPTISSATITNFGSTSANIATLTGTTFGATATTQLRGASGQITTLTGTSANITNISGTSLTITTNAYLATSSGNVGIGTASPGRQLTVFKASGDAIIKTESDSGGVFLEQDSTNGYWGINYAASGTNSAFIGSRGVNDIIAFYTGSGITERMRIDSSGNVGIGGTATAFAKVHVLGTLPTSSNASQGFRMSGEIPSGSTTSARSFISFPSTAAASFTLASLYHYEAFQGTFGAGSAVTSQYGFFAGDTLTGATNNYGFYSNIASGSNRWNFYAAGTAINYFAGDVLIGTTSKINGTSSPLHAYATTGSGIIVQMTQSDADTISVWNSATSGDNDFIDFYTEGSPTLRGNITYNRGAGQVAYNTTSDYRAKTIIGPVTNSGELVDALKVYVGKMNGATVERPMLIAHEAQEIAPYAVSGEKDAVDKDGNPVYQQIDVSSLVPLLIAEVKSLRQRVAELEAK